MYLQLIIVEGYLKQMSFNTPREGEIGPIIAFVSIVVIIVGLFIMTFKQLTKRSYRKALEMDLEYTGNEQHYGRVHHKQMRYDCSWEHYEI